MTSPVLLTRNRSISLSASTSVSVTEPLAERYPGALAEGLYVPSGSLVNVAGFELFREPQVIVADGISSLVSAS